MKEIFDKYNIRRLWHFTAAANLASIEEHGGLLSLAALDKREIDVPEPGGDDESRASDRDSGAYKYVHLSFIKQSPMLHKVQTKYGRLLNARWLSINPAVAFFDGVMYCEGYANVNNASLINAEKAAQKIDFEVLFTYMDWNQPEIKKRLHHARKAEILIPHRILWENIIEVIPA